MQIASCRVVVIEDDKLVGSTSIMHTMSIQLRIQGIPDEPKVGAQLNAGALVGDGELMRLAECAKSSV